MNSFEVFFYVRDHENQKSMSRESSRESESQELFRELCMRSESIESINSLYKWRDVDVEEFY